MKRPYLFLIFSLSLISCGGSGGGSSSLTKEETYIGTSTLSPLLLTAYESLGDNEITVPCPDGGTLELTLVSSTSAVYAYTLKLTNCTTVMLCNGSKTIIVNGTGTLNDAYVGGMGITYKASLQFSNFPSGSCEVDMANSYDADGDEFFNGGTLCGYAYPSEMWGIAETACTTEVE